MAAKAREIVIEWNGRGSWESDDIKKWIEGVDGRVAAEIGKLILTFGQLEHAMVGLISARLGRQHGKPLGFSKAALILADNTFSQSVNLFRSLGQDIRLDESELELDKEFALAVLKASSARNEIVHAWFRGSGQPGDSFYEYWKKKPSAKGGSSSTTRTLNAESVNEAVQIVIAAFEPLVQLADYKRFRSYQGGPLSQRYKVLEDGTYELIESRRPTEDSKR